LFFQQIFALSSLRYISTYVIKEMNVIHVLHNESCFFLYSSLLILFSFFFVLFSCTESVLLVQEYNQNASFSFVYGSIRRDRDTIQKDI
jgi:hypothetical protein